MVYFKGLNGIELIKQSLPLKNNIIPLVVVVQSLSHVQLFVIQWMAACQASLSFTMSHSLLTLTSIESMMPPNHLILCHVMYP